VLNDIGIKDLAMVANKIEMLRMSDSLGKRSPTALLSNNGGRTKEG